MSDAADEAIPVEPTAQETPAPEPLPPPRFELVDHEIKEGDQTAVARRSQDDS